MEVISLREQKSKYDTIFKGRQVRFQVEGCSCEDAVNANFSLELRAKETMPEAICRAMGKDPEEIVLKELVSEHIQVKWWEKFLGITLKRKVEKWARYHNKRMSDMTKSEELANKLKGEIG